MTFNETSLSDFKTCNNGSSGQATSASKYLRCQLILAKIFKLMQHPTVICHTTLTSPQ